MGMKKEIDLLTLISDNTSWEDEIKLGMRLIADGCYRDFACECFSTSKCPFKDYCKQINTIPDEWYLPYREEN